MADITVEVSSAGLTAYGAGTWGSESFGGYNITNVSIGSVDAFYPDEGWGGYYWGYLVWGQNFEDALVNVTTPTIQSSVGNENIEGDGNVFLSTNLLNLTVDAVSAQANFIITVDGSEISASVNSVFAGENIIVEVTTPGSPTTWGASSWGAGAWNQITGILVEQGDETVEGTGSVNLTGIQSNTTTGTLSLIGDANLTLLTNIINVTAASISTKVDVDVELTSPGNLPWGTTSWGYGTWGNIGGMDVEQGGEEESIPGVEVFVSTNLLSLTLTSIAQVTGDANLTLNTNLLTTILISLILLTNIVLLSFSFLIEIITLYKFNVETINSPNIKFNVPNSNSKIYLLK